MRVKTSVTLSPELLAAIDRSSGGSRRRSEFIEQVVGTFLKEKEREERSAREIALLNLIAAGKLGELPDVTDYSVQWWELGDDVETIGDDS
jgi:metal-responsive CopG/Arc/MetJ family transcriptional regulator